MKSLVIHGRQPAIGRAELESLYGASSVEPTGQVGSIIDIEPAQINFSRLGGMVKFCKILTTLDTVDWTEIHSFLAQNVPKHLEYLPEGKLRLGLSSYGIKVSPARMQASGLEVKKIIKANNQSARYIPNIETALNSAQVLHNKLTQKLGWELVFVANGKQTIVAQSIAIQDIERYASRDQKRPYRDAKIGMLPPKLAQIIINLAVSDTQVSNANVILDPFCGTGVVLQEASLMGLGYYGSDIDKRMIDYSNKNLTWLFETNPTNITHDMSKNFFPTEVADATKHSWKHPFNTVACESYLGRPFSTIPDSSTLEKVISDCDTIHRKFFSNLARQVNSGFRLCVAVPTWKIGKDFHHMPILDHLEELGYNRLSFVHAKNRELVYHRPDQIVGRELVVAERI